MLLKFSHVELLLLWVLIVSAKRVGRERLIWGCVTSLCFWWHHGEHTTFDTLFISFYSWLSSRLGSKTKKEIMSYDSLFNRFSCHVICSWLRQRLIFESLHLAIHFCFWRLNLMVWLKICYWLCDMLV